jgi:hypothetical protein
MLTKKKKLISIVKKRLLSETQPACPSIEGKELILSGALASVELTNNRWHFCRDCPHTYTLDCRGPTWCTTTTASQALLPIPLW